MDDKFANLEAILFDLDETLLGNQIDAFAANYFKILGKYAASIMEPERFLQELLICTQAMMSNTDTAVSNREVFWDLFQARTGQGPEDLEPFFDRFYRTQFSQLRSLTQQRPEAAELIQACFDRGLKVVIATNPAFPLVAIEERLAWAGVPVTQFPYDLVTSYEIMHAAKPSSQYYREILEKIDCQPENALMVGDEWENDIVPTAELGLYTYWVNQNGAHPQDASLLDGHGTLADLAQILVVAENPEKPGF